MIAPWENDAYKALDVSRIQGAPHDMPSKFVEWLPKNFESTVTSAKDLVSHLMDVFEAYDAGKHEDVVLKLFVKSLEGDAGQCFK